MPVVSRYFDAAVQAATTPRERMLAGALASASPHMRWIAPYRSEEGAEKLAAGYAVTMLSMPGPPPREGYQSLFANPNVLVAFTLQAPRIFYPLHRHKAGEIYHVISGVAQWQRDGEPWRRRQPGEWLFHAGDQGHAMRTGAEPLLAMAAWIDHLDCPPPVLEVEEADRGSRAPGTAAPGRSCAESGRGRDAFFGPDRRDILAGFRTCAAD